MLVPFLFIMLKPEPVADFVSYPVVPYPSRLRESDVRRISYGGMLVEGVLAGSQWVRIVLCSE